MTEAGLVPMGSWQARVTVKSIGNPFSTENKPQHKQKPLLQLRDPYKKKTKPKISSKAFWYLVQRQWFRFCLQKVWQTAPWNIHLQQGYVLWLK